MNNALSLALAALAVYMLTRGGPPAVEGSPLLSSVPSQSWSPDNWYASGGTSTAQQWVTAPGSTALVLM